MAKDTFENVIGATYYIPEGVSLYSYNTKRAYSTNRYLMFTGKYTFSAKKGQSGKWYLITSGDHKGKYLYDPKKKVVKESDDVAPVETTEATSENGQPVNTDSEGNETVTEQPDDFYMDDSFFTSYSTEESEDTYGQKLAEGLTIKDIRAILGIPHQFLPVTDCRIDESDSYSALGRIYSERILKNIPLLLITPGVPQFMASFSKDQKGKILTELISGASASVQSQLTDRYSGKYYSLKYAYVDYFQYVNAMLRSAAVFLGINDVKIDGTKLGKMNWLYKPTSDGTDIFGHEGLSRFLGPYAGAIALYADAGSTVDDSFSNATTESQLSSTLNSLSDTGRELNFLVGNVGSVVGLSINKLTGQEDLENNMANVQKEVDRVLGGGNIMSNILNKAQTILAGGRLIFPEIWSDSTFGRSYSCRMKLVSPSGDKLSIYLNILVPIYHLLAMCLPRQSIDQSYFSPFLLRCYYKGLFNVDMGIMTGLSITKGAEAEWTIDGLPTVAEISFEIKDLYDGMFMSRAESSKDMNILSNITELDYIANSCGININDQEVMRTFKLWSVLTLDNTISDMVANGIFGNITQFFNSKLNSLFGVF